MTNNAQDSTDRLEIRSSYDAIIAGAGPVGLFLATELALAGCSVLVLEKAPDESPLKRLPFGMRGLNTLSIAALDRRGLLGELDIHQLIRLPGAQAANARPGGHFAGIQFPGDKIDPAQWPYFLPGPTAPQLMTAIEELEGILSRRAISLGVQIYRDTPVTAFHQDGDGVYVTTNGGTFHAAWLIGCDGSRSVVRKAAGFEFAGTEPEFTGYTLLADLCGTERLKPGRNFTSHGMYMQSQPGYIFLQDFDGGAFHDSGQSVTRAYAETLLRHISGLDIRLDTLHRSSTWTDRARQATSYRKGRILLAGDAAHIHSPLGGQGLNLGLGDAMNLGWKLAAVIRNTAPEAILDTYEAERYPIGEQVLDWSRAQVAIMRPERHSAALRAIISELMQTRDGATYFAGRTWGLLTGYPVTGGHPLTGRPAPDFEFEGSMRSNALMTGGNWLLLDFESNSELQTIAEQLAPGLCYYKANPTERLGLSALLIRPDGFVAWAADAGIPDENGLRMALKGWYMG